MNLFDWVPPQILGPRHGETYNEKRDRVRLDGQAGDVVRLMQDGEWRMLAEMSMATGHPEASVSARLRDFRRAGFTVERKYLSKGLWSYRVLGA